MISEGSCDTEDWSNDAENTGIEKKVLTFYQYFDQIIAALVSRRAIFQKHLKKSKLLQKYYWRNKGFSLVCCRALGLDSRICCIWLFRESESSLCYVICSSHLHIYFRRLNHHYNDLKNVLFCHDSVYFNQRVLTKSPSNHYLQ